MKWVLTVGVYPGSADTVREVYHIGSFNGTTFTSDNPNTELMVDNGRDFYAARTWRDYDSANQAKRTILGWMGSWLILPMHQASKRIKGKAFYLFHAIFLLKPLPKE